MPFRFRVGKGDGAEQAAYERASGETGNLVGRSANGICPDDDWD